MRNLKKPRHLKRIKNVSVNEVTSEPWYFTHYQEKKGEFELKAKCCSKSRKYAYITYAIALSVYLTNYEVDNRD